jgi:hypothetical protein
MLTVTLAMQTATATAATACPRRWPLLKLQK